MTLARHLARGAATLITGVAVVAAIATGISMWAGYRPQPVLTGSMVPYLPVGSLTIAKPVAATSVRVGEVITFQRPDGKGTITHRVRRIVERDGMRLATTKGDANPTSDPWQLELRGQVGHDVADIPYVGYVAIYAARPQVHGGAIALFAILLLVGALRAIWRDRRSPAAA